MLRKRVRAAAIGQPPPPRNSLIGPFSGARRELLLEANRRGMERNPLVALGVELIPATVDMLVTPEAVQAMFDAKSAASTTGRRGAVPARWPRLEAGWVRHAVPLCGRGEIGTPAGKAGVPVPQP